MRSPLILLLFILAAVSSCSRPNASFCCTTDEQCVAAGVDGLRPCGAGQACSLENTCVAKECDTSTDCTSPDAPTCSNGLCVAGCRTDDDCVGVPGAPHCDVATTTCVGCVSSDQCPAEAAICDGETRACRGCLGDDDCTSGACIEADAICAIEEDVIYVSAMGDDSGPCTKAMPCATIAVALMGTTTTRRFIKILSGTLNATNTISLRDSVVIDGTNTVLVSAANPVIEAGSNVTIEGVQLPASPATARVPSGTQLRLFDVLLDGGFIQVLAGGKLELANVTHRNTEVNCSSGGEVVATRSVFDRSPLRTDNCTLTVSRSRLGPGFGIIETSSGVLTIENNLFVETLEGNEIVRMFGPGVGSTFRFNTVVNSSAVVSNGSGIICGGPEVTLTSNILAYNSSQPLGVACTARFTLFDAPAVQQAMQGVGNIAGDAITFFADRSSGDYHLAPGSPARELGEPGLLTIDIDGVPRPNPTGSDPDGGAFEAP